MVQIFGVEPLLPPGNKPIANRSAVRAQHRVPGRRTRDTQKGTLKDEMCGFDLVRSTRNKMLPIEVSMAGNQMRILSATLQLILVFGLVACSSSDQEKAKEQAHEDGRKASEEAKKAGQEIKKEAKELSSQVSAAVRPGGAASEGVAHAEEGAKDAAARANVHLDHAALLARVKAKLASDAGLATLKNVNVRVTGTVVTLSGTVANEYQKKAAAIAASQVEGVTRVQDRIAVQN